MTNVRTLVDAVKSEARPLKGYSDDHDALLGRIGEARFVLVGDASHGTHEFYRERARLTRRLDSVHPCSGGGEVPCAVQRARHALTLALRPAGHTTQQSNHIGGSYAYVHHPASGFRSPASLAAGPRPAAHGHLHGPESAGHRRDDHRPPPADTPRHAPSARSLSPRGPR